MKQRQHAGVGVADLHEEYATRTSGVASALWIADKEDVPRELKSKGVVLSGV